MERESLLLIAIGCLFVAFIALLLEYMRRQKEMKELIDEKCFSILQDIEKYDFQLHEIEYEMRQLRNDIEKQENRNQSPNQ